MNPSRASRWLPLVAAAALLPFANGRYSIPLAAWLAPLFLLRFVRTQPARIGLPIGYALLVGMLAFQFRGMLPLPAAPYFGVMAAVGALIFLPYLVDRWLGGRLADSSARLLLFPATATALQFATAFGPFGTWAVVAHSQAGQLGLLQLASVTGIWGIDFLIFLTAPVANHAWERGWRSPSAVRAIGGFAALVGLVVLAGQARVRLFPLTGKTVRIASLSHADLEPAPSSELWARISDGSAGAADRAAFAAWAKRVDDDLLARADREAAAGAKLVFWDETGAIVLDADEPALLARGRELAARRHIYLGMSLGTWSLGQTHPLQNKLVLVDPDGRIVAQYHKGHPVLGSESRFVANGHDPLPDLETPFGRLSAIICADADHPRLLLQAGAMHADLVLDPSSDWREIDPWHTDMASVRAIEEGVTLVRQTSYGLSAAFDAHGVTLASVDYFRSDGREMVAEVPTAGVRTLYARFGDWFGWLCVAAVVGLFVLAFRAPPPDPSSAAVPSDESSDPSDSTDACRPHPHHRPPSRTYQ